MKIVIYLKHFPLDWQTLGEGTSKAVRGFAAGLVNAGAAVTVACEGAAPGVRLTEGGYDVRRFAGGGRGSSFRVSPALRAWLTGPDKPDLVLLNGMFLPSTYVLSRHLKRAGVPYILAPHDPYNTFMFRKSAMRKAVYWRLFERHVLNDSLAVQVLDSRHAQWLQQRGIAAPTLCVPCGHDPAEAPMPGSSTANGDRPPSFYFLGRLDAYNKGLDLLIEGFVRALGDTSARLVLQGPDWGDSAALKELAARHLPRLPGVDRIQFQPAAFDRAATDLMRDHDVICVPSRYEGFSLQALEGMLAGKVILSSAICGISPFVEAAGCGVVVESSAEGVAAGLRSLWARRSEWPEMGQKGQALARTSLCWDDIASHAMTTYRTLLTQPPTSQTPGIQAESKTLAYPAAPPSRPAKPVTATILGVRVDPLNMPLALDTIDRWVADKERHYVCIRDVHGIMACQTDVTLRRIHDEAGMVTPDGMPLVWLTRRNGYPETDRVCGPDFMLELCDHSQARGYRHFLYGGAPGVVADLKANLEARFPDLQIVGTYSPPFRPLSRDEDAAVVNMINAAQPDILWVGLSSPKQEYWMSSHKGRIAAAAMIGVGAAFDFHAGRQKRAPAWMQRNGLEWSYRLMSEPRRLWRRYLVLAPRFLMLLAAGKIRSLGHRTPSDSPHVRES